MVIRQWNPHLDSKILLGEWQCFQILRWQTYCQSSLSKLAVDSSCEERLFLHPDRMRWFRLNWVHLQHLRGVVFKTADRQSRLNLGPNRDILLLMPLVLHALFVNYFYKYISVTTKNLLQHTSMAHYTSDLGSFITLLALEIMLWGNPLLGYGLPKWISPL